MSAGTIEVPFGVGHRHPLVGASEQALYRGVHVSWGGTTEIDLADEMLASTGRR
jgi:hypothetical protein